MRRIPRLAISLTTPLAVGLASAAFVGDRTVRYYGALVKPSFAPPPWVFGPAWTLLYLTMGLALFLVWSADTSPRLRRIAIGLFAVQLAINAAWSPVFFAAEAPRAALAVLAALWIAILATLLAFRPISRRAALLLAPYLAWVSFAGALNAAIVLENPA